MLDERDHVRGTYPPQDLTITGDDARSCGWHGQVLNSLSSIGVAAADPADPKASQGEEQKAPPSSSADDSMRLSTLEREVRPCQFLPSSWMCCAYCDCSISLCFNVAAQSPWLTP